MRNDERRYEAEVTVIGSPTSRRVAAFVAAVERCGGRADVISYAEAVGGRCRPRPGGFVRLESPGDCVQTTRDILRAGIEPLAEAGGSPLSADQIERWAGARGEIPPPRQWFLGYRHLLLHLQNAWPEAQWLTSPAVVAAVFDKSECLSRWSKAALPVPPRYFGIDDYAQLRERIPDRHARLFLKLRYGYSSIGAAAVEWRDRRFRLITTLEVDRSTAPPRWFLSKRPRVVNSESEAAQIIDLLGKEEMLVEAWLPKARWNGVPFDLRLLVIGGRLRHVVGRALASPFTNLNLDACRVPQEAIIRHLSEAWTEIVSTAERAAGVFPDAGALGIDLLVRSDRRRTALLEANAFGDYLPGLLDRGESTYEAEWKFACSAVGEIA